jgi:hypothetical protein
MEWNSYPTSKPIENQRVLVSDGETILIAWYVLSDNHINWFFDNGTNDLEILWWHELPIVPPQI